MYTFLHSTTVYTLTGFENCDATFDLSCIAERRKIGIQNLRRDSGLYAYVHCELDFLK